MTIKLWYASSVEGATPYITSDEGYSLATNYNTAQSEQFRIRQARIVAKKLEKNYGITPIALTVNGKEYDLEG